MLATLRIRSVPLHSALPQIERAENLASFRSGLAKVLVATDVASRGLDIPDATSEDIMKVAEASMRSYWDVEPFAVNPQMVYDGIMMANALGMERKGL